MSGYQGGHGHSHLFLQGLIGESAVIQDAALFAQIWIGQ